MKGKKITKASIYQILLGLVPFLFFILILIPVVWMALSSLKSTNEIFEDLWALPETWLFSNYAEAWNTGISSYFKNSLIVTIGTCLLNVTVCSLYAFSLVVFEFKGKRLFHLIAIGGLMFSPIVSLIPLYQELQALHLYNTRLALILIYTAFQMPLCFILTYNYFKDIDRAYVEAARLDGCRSIQILSHVFLPMSKPIIMTMIVLTAFYAWNEFTFALIFISGEVKKTVPIGLLAFQGEMHAEWSVLLAGLTISAIPIIIFFILTQKYFIAGLNAGGVKG